MFMLRPKNNYNTAIMYECYLIVQNDIFLTTSNHGLSKLRYTSKGKSIISFFLTELFEMRCYASETQSPMCGRADACEFCSIVSFDSRLN